MRNGLEYGRMSIIIREIRRNTFHTKIIFDRKKSKAKNRCAAGDRIKDMAYQAIYFVEYGYHEDAFRHAGADANGMIRKEPEDGAQSRYSFGDALHLFRRRPGEKDFREILYYKDRPVEVMITDSRTTVRIEEYQLCRSMDETMIDLFNRSSGHIPAYRRNEKALLGMVRYEWMSGISYLDGTEDTKGVLRLFYKDDMQSQWYVEIHFPEEESIHVLAEDIVYRLCNYRLIMSDPKTDKEEVFFRTKHLESFGEGSAHIHIPTSYPAPGGNSYRPGRDS